MLDTQTRFLTAALVVFVFLSALFTWSTIYRRLNTFAVGSAPTQVVDTTPPTLPAVRASDPRIGSTQINAVEIVEFADYRCIHCRAMAPDLLSLLTNRQYNVRLIWREAPTLDQSQENLLPFAAARCAQAQNAFQGMHAALFQANTLTETTILAAAQGLGLDMTRFKSCIADTRIYDSIRQDQATALANHISAAPTLFVRGQPYVGQLELNDLQALVR